MTRRREGGGKPPPARGEGAAIDIETIKKWMKEAAPDWNIDELPLKKSKYLQCIGSIDWAGLNKREKELLSIRNKIARDLSNCSRILLGHFSCDSLEYLPSGPEGDQVRSIAADLTPLLATLNRSSDALIIRSHPWWHYFASMFSEALVQAWEDGGNSFFRGKLPRFGKSENAGRWPPLVVVTHRLLKASGKHDVGLRAVSEALRNGPDPGPYVPDPNDSVGAGFDSYMRGEWEQDANGRRSRTPANQNLAENKPKKKRGRPRTRDNGRQAE